jgi:hypothetical protein
MRDRYCFSSCGGEFGVDENDMAGEGGGGADQRVAPRTRRSFEFIRKLNGWQDDDND